MTDRILKEFEKLGRFRVRLLESVAGPKLDIREFIEDDGIDGAYVGFTKSGIRLDSEQTEILITGYGPELIRTIEESRGV